MDAPIEVITPDTGRPFRALAHGGPSFPVYWHRHAEYELLCATPGGESRIADLVERPELPRVLLLGPHLPHAWPMDVPYEHVVVQFRRDWLGSGFLATAGCAGLADLLDRAAGALVVEGPAALALTARVREMLPLAGIPAIAALLGCLDAFAAAGPRPLLADVPDAARDARLQRVLDWIAAQAGEDIGLADAAGRAAMHPKAFARWFRRATGHSFVGYLGHVRVQRACALLRDGDRAITAIALDAGFGTVANFNRVFRRLRRMTPSAYRASLAATGAPAR